MAPGRSRRSGWVQVLFYGSLVVAAVVHRSATAERDLTPARVVIPAISVDSQVDSVGTKDRVLQIPPDPRVVGWWKDGATAGAEEGAVILAAHLDTRKHGAGPFTRVYELDKGDTMMLSTGEGDDFQYRVSAVQTFHKEALPYDRLFAQDGPARVVLVTCAGRFDRASEQYDSNVVVTFEPV